MEAYVNDKVLRATELRRMDEMENLDKPSLANRPPSGYSLSQDATLYSHLYMIGWVKWQPGRNYNIRINVRMKKTIHPTNDDVFLNESKSLIAPQDVSVFDENWKNYKSVVLSETAGIDRTGEPVEVLLAFYPDEAQQIVRDIHVVAVDPETYAITEVNSQAYDIQKFMDEDKLVPDENDNPTR